ncbi:MAG: AAA family ATPase [Bacteroidales bacterium]|nr:AAA family ATPase [Bacteroidales bacterium]
MAYKERRRKVNRYLIKRKKQFQQFLKRSQSDNSVNNFRSVDIGSRNGNHKILNTNVDFHQPKLNRKQIEIAEQNEVKKKRDVVDKVSVDELKPQTKGIDQLATPFDMFKDEYTLEEMLDLKITEIPFLVEKLIPKETLVVLAGQSEIGKSTLYTQLALAIVRGDNEFLGCKLNSKHKRVLIISTEDGCIPFSFRTNRQIIQSPIGVEKRKNFKVIFSYDNLENRIKNHLEKTPVDLVVIDAFGDVFQGEINASNSVRQFLNKYVSFIQKYGCAILFVHHVCKGNKKQKSDKDQLLGSTGIEGKMRNVLMLSIVNDQHQLSIAKGNYVNREDKNNPIYLSFDDKTLTFSKADCPAKPKETNESTRASGSGSSRKGRPGRQKDMKLYNLAIKRFNEKVPQVEIAKEVGRDKSTVCKWLKGYNESKGYDFSKVGEVD